MTKRVIRVKRQAHNISNRNTLVLKLPTVTIRMPPNCWKAVILSDKEVVIIHSDYTIGAFEADCKAFIREGK